MPGVGTGFQPVGQSLKRCAAQKPRSAGFLDPFCPRGSTLWLSLIASEWQWFSLIGEGYQSGHQKDQSDEILQIMPLANKFALRFTEEISQLIFFWLTMPKDTMTARERTTPRYPLESGLRCSVRSAGCRAPGDFGARRILDHVELEKPVQFTY